MALTSSSTLTNAIDQYKNNLRYWESSTKAANLLEAVLWLLNDQALSYSIDGKSITRQSLEKLQEKLIPRVEAQSDTDRQHFTRGIPMRRIGQ